MEKRYKLPAKEDYEILAKCEKLEGLSLGNDDRILVELIKTQLEDDWRTPLLEKLNQMLKKYNRK